MNSHTLQLASALSRAWADSIVRASIQGALLAGLVWIFIFVFKKLPASVRTALWWIVCLKFVFTLLLTPVQVPILKPRSEQSASRLHAYSSPIPSNPLPAISEPVPPPPAKIDAQTALLAFWILGVGLTSVLSIIPFAKMRRIARGSHQVDDVNILEDAGRLAKELGLKRLPRLLFSDQVAQIVTFGVWRPVILISRTAFEACTATERRMILAHELSHVRRKDGLLALLPQVTQILFFFHPLAWLASYEFTFAREAECDQSAIRLTHAAPDQYARLLLRLGVAKTGATTLCTPGVSSHFQLLRRRIIMIDRFVKNSTIRPLKSLSATVRALALLSVLPVSLVEGQNPMAAKPAPTVVSRTSRSVYIAHLSKTSSKAKFTQARAAMIAKLAPKPAVAKATVSGETTVFNLQFAKAGAAAAMLRQLFKSEEVTVVPDDRINIIVVRGSKAMTGQVASVLKNLDQPTPQEEKKDEERETRIFKVHFAMANDIATELATSVGARRGVNIAVDARTNGLVVVASSAKMAVIQRLITDLDTPVTEVTPPEYHTHIIRLKYAKASAVLQILTSVVPKGPDVQTIVPDPSTNSLVVVADRDGEQQLANVIAQIDIDPSNK